MKLSEMIIHTWMPHLIPGMKRPAVCGSLYVDGNNTTTDPSKITCKSCLRLIKDDDKLRRRAEKLVKRHLEEKEYFLNVNINRIAELIRDFKLNKDQVIEAYNRATIAEVMNS